MPVIGKRKAALSSESDRDIVLSLIPPDKVKVFWPRVEARIEAALETSAGRFSASDILREIERGTQSLWVIAEGATVLAGFTSKVYQVPKGRVCSVEWLGGDGMDEWLDGLVSVMEQYARTCGCSRIETHGRRGCGRLLRR